MANPYMKRFQNKQAHGRKAEKVFAHKVRLMPGSGSIAGQKGDVELESVLCELKSTTHGSLGVQKKWLDKISTEALEMNRVPALAINFVTLSGGTIDNGAWVMVPLWSFVEKYK